MEEVREYSPDFILQHQSNGYNPKVKERYEHALLRRFPKKPDTTVKWRKLMARLYYHLRQRKKASPRKAVWFAETLVEKASSSHPLGVLSPASDVPKLIKWDSEYNKAVLERTDFCSISQHHCIPVADPQVLPEHQYLDAEGYPKPFNCDYEPATQMLREVERYMKVLPQSLGKTISFIEAFKFYMSHNTRYKAMPKLTFTEEQRQSKAQRERAYLTKLLQARRT